MALNHKKEEKTIIKLKSTVKNSGSKETKIFFSFLSNPRLLQTQNIFMPNKQMN